MDTIYLDGGYPVCKEHAAQLIELACNADDHSRTEVESLSLEELEKLHREAGH